MATDYLIEWKSLRNNDRHDRANGHTWGAFVRGEFIASYDDRYPGAKEHCEAFVARDRATRSPPMLNREAMDRGMARKGVAGAGGVYAVAADPQLLVALDRFGDPISAAINFYEASALTQLAKVADGLDCPEMLLGRVWLDSLVEQGLATRRETEKSRRFERVINEGVHATERQTFRHYKLTATGVRVVMALTTPRALS